MSTEKRREEIGGGEGRGGEGRGGGGEGRGGGGEGRGGGGHVHIVIRVIYNMLLYF